MAPDTAALTKRPIARDADLDRMRERAGALRGRIGADVLELKRRARSALDLRRQIAKHPIAAAAGRVTSQSSPLRLWATTGTLPPQSARAWAMAAARLSRSTHLTSICTPGTLWTTSGLSPSALPAYCWPLRATNPAPRSTSRNCSSPRLPFDLELIFPISISKIFRCVNSNFNI